MLLIPSVCAVDVYCKPLGVACFILTLQIFCCLFSFTGKNTHNTHSEKRNPMKRLNHLQWHSDQSRIFIFKLRWVSLTNDIENRFNTGTVYFLSYPYSENPASSTVIGCSQGQRSEPEMHIIYSIVIYIKQNVKENL